MRQITRNFTCFWLGTVAVLTASVAAQDTPSPGSTADGAQPPAQVAPAQTSPDQAAPDQAADTEAPLPLADSQEAIKSRYHRFEKTMLDMVRFLEKTDPQRAAILSRAISRSQSDGVGPQMEKLVELLQDQNQLGEAVDRQDQVMNDLQALLELLMSDDREKELAREKERIEQYLKDLNKIIAGQKDVRAATERGESGKALTPRQEKLTEKTRELGRQISEDEKSGQPQGGNQAPEGQDQQQETPESPDGKNAPAEEGQPSDDASGEDQKGSKPSDSSSEKGPDKDKESPAGKEKRPENGPSGEQPQDSGDEQSPDKSSPQDPADSGSPKSSSQKPSDSQPGSPESQPGESQPGESPSGESQEGQSSESQSASQPKPKGQNELEKAKKAMEKAIEKLQRDLKKDASRNQDEALRELQQAKERLEEILRQIREEERLLQLVGLEARFQRMLAQQIAIYNDTAQIDKVPDNERASRHQLKIEELALMESELVLETTKALGLLKEEGTAVAFPEAIEQLRYDMQTVVDQLRQMNVGALTQTVELDIIDGLKEMIDAMQQEIDKEKQKDQQSQQQGGGEQQQQDEELLKKIAELKMLKSLQIRINSRTVKLSQLLTDEQATQPEIIRQIQELSIRQERIQRATYDLATGKNQ